MIFISPVRDERGGVKRRDERDDQTAFFRPWRDFEKRTSGAGFPTNELVGYFLSSLRDFKPGELSRSMASTAAALRVSTPSFSSK